MSWSPGHPISESDGCSTGTGNCCRPFCRCGLIKAAVRRHFARTVSYLVYQNLSRLSTQWEESINGALWGVEKEARRRLDELMGTVERLVESGSNERAPQLRADLERLEKARKSLAAGDQELIRYLLVVIGGGTGALARYVAASAIMTRFGGKFPLGTLVINVTGSFLIGFLMTMLTERFKLDPNWRLLLVVGFLGGLHHLFEF